MSHLLPPDLTEGLCVFAQNIRTAHLGGGASVNIHIPLWGSALALSVQKFHVLRFSKAYPKS